MNAGSKSSKAIIERIGLEGITESSIGYCTRGLQSYVCSYKLGRTNNRGDGLLTAVHKDYFRVLNLRDLLFNDCGDRVAQLLHVELVPPYSQYDAHQQVLIVNTHLLFPHDSTLSIVRLQQVYKILQYVESYQKEVNLSPMPIILCGDWNGRKRGHVYKFLWSQEFVSSYDTAHRYTDSDAHKWVSHRNHRGNICAVDFIWLLNPNRYRKLLKTSWSEAVFGMFRYLLRRASLTAEDAFAFLKTDNDGDHITFMGFCETLRQLAALLMIEMKKVQNSPWVPYINRLPRPAEMHSTDDRRSRLGKEKGLKGGNKGRGSWDKVDVGLRRRRGGMCGGERGGSLTVV
ncbi:unnamed protein product [Microthlaspi erraticum]|uniref:Endonuclease/exonuclease/phosphatase domain-containing protein n=1 Tax=Microthlaspi erraticum TaxID=1685480 RepID=A0A6D2HPT7_9BRAS|nr:unnamed protein product [Microthlaspi erraticum]